MPKYLPLLDAQKLSKSNQSAYQKLMSEHLGFETDAVGAQAALDAAFTRAFEEFLSPFAQSFALLKNVTLDELPTTTATPELNEINVELRGVGIQAVDALTTLAGGSAAGAAVGGLTFAAVGAFATASTGAAIGGLSGAAATSATLAWLGGGSVAAGGYGVAGGTMVLGGIVAAPVLLALGGFVYYKGKSALREQERVDVELKKAAAEFKVQRAAADVVIAQITRTADVATRLTKSGAGPLAYFSGLVRRNDDYTTYDEVQRGMVAELAGLATTIAAVIACPIVTEDGTVSPISAETLAAADSLLERTE